MEYAQIMTCIAFHPFELRFCHRLAWASKERKLNTTTCVEWLKWKKKDDKCKRFGIQNKITLFVSFTLTAFVCHSLKIILYGSYFFMHLLLLSGVWWCMMCARLYTVVSFFYRCELFRWAVAAVLLFLCCGLQFKRATIKNGPGFPYEQVLQKKKKRKSKKNSILILFVWRHLIF